VIAGEKLLQQLQAAGMGGMPVLPAAGIS